MNLKLSDFDFQLPQELIAQEPAEPRDSCRLMILNRQNESIQEKKFYEIIDYFVPGDVLVLNDTKVIPARLFARRAGKPEEKPIEIFLLKETDKNCWQVLSRPAKKLKLGTRLVFEDGTEARVTEILAGAAGRLIAFFPETEVLNLAAKIGQLPLPPYIKNYPKKTSDLAQDYQTVFAQKDGATAAPTAGLHFTEKLLEKIKAKGIEILFITLHTGLGTFQPIPTNNFTEHQLLPEFCEISPQTAQKINAAKAGGRQLWACGTTVARALESASSAAGRLHQFSAETSLFIYPGYQFKIVSGLLTNFHLPKSSLILLASAFTGIEFLREAYKIAIKKKFRFFSFGDAMLII